MNRHILLIILENGRILFEDRTPHDTRSWVLCDSELQAPFNIRVHGQKTIYHVVSFVLARSTSGDRNDYTVARAAVKTYLDARNIEVLDLNDKDPKWRRQK